MKLTKTKEKIAKKYSERFTVADLTFIYREAVSLEIAQIAIRALELKANK